MDKKPLQAKVTVTLSKPEWGSYPEVERVILDESGQTRITFRVYYNGEYTALVYVDEFVITKKIDL